MGAETSAIFNLGNAVIVGIIGTCAALWVKRRWSLADRRERQDDKCERYENAYRILCFWVRGLLQRIATIVLLKNKPGYGEQYALQRLDELAVEPSPLEDLQKYIDGVIEIEDIEHGA